MIFPPDDGGRMMMQAAGAEKLGIRVDIRQGLYFNEISVSAAPVFQVQCKQITEGAAVSAPMKI